jgi:hypothetical protein
LKQVCTGDQLVRTQQYTFILSDWICVYLGIKLTCQVLWVALGIKLLS